MNISYIAILNDGLVLKDPTLEHLVNNPYIVYLFKEEYSNKNRYMPISKDGSHQKLLFGGFELIHIGEDFARDCLRDYGHNVTVRETKTGQNRQIFIPIMGSDFIPEGLIPLMQRLDSLGSLEMYDKFTEYESAIAENQKLKAEIEKLKQELAELKSGVST